MAAFKQLNEAGEKSHNHNDWLCFMTTNHRGVFSAAQESYYNLACYIPEEIEVIEENFHVCPFAICQITYIHLLCIPFFHSRWAIWGSMLAWTLDLTLSCQGFWSESDLFLYIISIPLCTETLSLAYKYVLSSMKKNLLFLHILLKPLHHFSVPMIAKPFLIENIVSSHFLHFISFTFRSTSCRYHTTERALVKVTPNC